MPLILAAQQVDERGRFARARARHVVPATRHAGRACMHTSLPRTHRSASPARAHALLIVIMPGGAEPNAPHTPARERPTHRHRSRCTLQTLTDSHACSLLLTHTHVARARRARRHAALALTHTHAHTLWFDRTHTDQVRPLRTRTSATQQMRSADGRGGAGGGGDPPHAQTRTHAAHAATPAVPPAARAHAARTPLRTAPHRAAPHRAAHGRPTGFFWPRGGVTGRPMPMPP